MQHIFSQYGFAWFGGLIAGFAAYAWLASMRRIPLLTMLDAGSPAAALGYGIGRIGCLLSGDGDYGTPTSLPWGMSFPNGLVPTTARVHPTPIYEFIAACFIAWWLWRYGRKQISALALNTHKPAAQAGLVFAAYLALTGLERFLVEFIRINPRSFLGMSNAQAAGLLSSLLELRCGGVCSIRRSRRRLLPERSSAAAVSPARATASTPTAFSRQAKTSDPSVRLSELVDCSLRRELRLQA